LALKIDFWPLNLTQQFQAKKTNLCQVLKDNFKAVWLVGIEKAYRDLMESTMYHLSCHTFRHKL